MSHPVRLLRGLYADIDASSMPMWAIRQQVSLARCAAALHRVPSARCLSHESAALIHGLWVPSQEPDLSVIVPSNPRHPRTPMPAVLGGRDDVVLRRRILRLPDSQITTVSGLSVSSIPRTALDCALDLPARDAVCIVDSALRALAHPSARQRRESERRGRAVLTSLEAELDQSAGRAGTRRARAVLAIASPFSESPGESVLRWLVMAMGLPAPVPQIGIEVAAGSQIYFPDLAWPGLRVYLEFDGQLKYQSPQDLWREKKRRDELARLGWRCQHVTWSQLRDLPRMRSQILDLFPARVVRGLRPVRSLWA
ncbi:hypothetical protein EII10_03125 [Actinomyces bowdenii]|uniref:DUF559 domain-containing protein n=1 Tax=Actinomyces bowdenii TaxID=131109 RepID=A0A3P1V7R2_9ACTO|nr:hypothetical protein EII10_03125 [Actinomyces bowdenii]